MTSPGPFSDEPGPRTLLPLLVDPEPPVADSAPPAPSMPEIGGSNALVEEVCPDGFSRALAGADAAADEPPQNSPAPEIPRAETPTKQVPQVSSNDSAGLGEPTLSQMHSTAPEMLVPGPRAEEPLPPRVSTPLVQSGVLPHLCFVAIPPGTFLMGSPENEPGRGVDEVQHQVTLTRGFSLQVTPVTQALWLAVMGANPSEFTQEGLDRPVENVSWLGCQVFIDRLNLMGTDKYRLPTEAEWEYACRAGTSTACAGGALTELQGGLDPALDASAWYCGNSGGSTHPAGKKQANAWGLYDLHGNVMEWCQDGYAPYGEIRMHKVQGEWVTTTSERTDPLGLPQGKTKVVRGGSWISTARQCRAAARLAWPADGKTNFIGLRLVRE